MPFARCNPSFNIPRYLPLKRAVLALALVDPGCFRSLADLTTFVFWLWRGRWFKVGLKGRHAPLWLPKSPTTFDVFFVDQCEYGQRYRPQGRSCI